MNCPNCDAPVQPNARFCGRCGQTLSQPEQPKCPNCQSPIKPTQRFCAKCGFDLKPEKRAEEPILAPTEPVLPPRPAPAPKPAPVGRPPTKRRPWVLAVLLVLLLAAVSAGAWWLLRAQPPAEGVADAPAPALTSAPTSASPSSTGDSAEAAWQAVQATVAAGDMGQSIAALQGLRNQYPEYQAQEVSEQLAGLCRPWAAQAASEADRAVLAVLDCLASVAPQDPLTAQQDWWRDYFSAQDQLSAGNTAEAVALLEPLTAAAPPDFAGGRHRAILYDAYLQQGDLACAVQDYETGRSAYLSARALDPTRVEAGNGIAACLPPTGTPTITPTATVTPTPLPPGEMKARFDEEGRFNVRTGPGFNYPIAARAETGAVFTVTGRTEDAAWLEAIDESDQNVWVLADLLVLNYPAGAAATVSETPLPPTDYVVADSVADFGPIQGDKYWFYTASRSPGSLEFDRIPLDGGWYRWNKGGKNPEMRLSAQGSYPSWNSDAMRLWVNLYHGKLRIEGRAFKEPGAGRGGNGVDLRIVQRRPKSEQDAGFERELWRGSLDPYDTDGFPIAVDPFDVEQRDEIYFITSAKGDDQLDNTVFTVRIILVNEGGAVLPATPTPTPRPPATAVPPLCFEPRLRHFEQHRGCCGEVVGIAYTNDGRLSWGNIHIEGPPATDQYKRDFVINNDGGYEITALTAFPPDAIYYTLRLTGNRIRSDEYVVKFEDAERIRAVVDWYQVGCGG